MEFVVLMLVVVVVVVVLFLLFWQWDLAGKLQDWKDEVNNEFRKVWNAIEDFDDTDIDDPTDIYDDPDVCPSCECDCDDDDIIVDVRACPCDLDNAVERLHAVADRFEAASAATDEPPAESLPKFNTLDCPACGLSAGCKGYAYVPASTIQEFIRQAEAKVLRHVIASN